MVPATAWTVLIRNGFSLSRFPFVFNLDFSSSITQLIWLVSAMQWRIHVRVQAVLVCSGMTKNVSALSKLRQIQMGSRVSKARLPFI
ncbi:hypothetical protein BDV30DRAFT_212547 [Aspergillus minisclerotigenes]|uniref:Uncharacterized protein n=1 Tax=Aspergillus minisclerotigenes TaxID=656917 RepID=A0A5N6J084_9EURO|nr:hypothetical protein BDV30DRAFT_212547 [Aspergillus minisclerotigenes]